MRKKSGGTFIRFETMKIQLYAIYERHKQHISYSRQGLFRGLPLGLEQKLADQDDLLRLCLSVKSSIFSGLRVLWWVAPSFGPAQYVLRFCTFKRRKGGVGTKMSQFLRLKLANFQRFPGNLFCTTYYVVHTTAT